MCLKTVDIAAKKTTKSIFFKLMVRLAVKGRAKYRFPYRDEQEAVTIGKKLTANADAVKPETCTLCGSKMPGKLATKKGQKYEPGFHNLLTLADARLALAQYVRLYPKHQKDARILKVKAQTVTAVGTQYLGERQTRPCVVTKHVTLVKEVK